MSDMQKDLKKNNKLVDQDIDNIYQVKIDALEQQVADNLHGWKKALADYQNLQKDSDKKLDGLSDYILGALILELLPIFDNYRLACEHIPAEQKTSAWAVGLEHILKMWEQFLTDQQITKIDTVSKVFDPLWHEAMDKVHDDKLPDQQIVKELLPGYCLKENLIRPSQVVVNNLE
jgi:molecular chaperone GrpE